MFQATGQLAGSLLLTVLLLLLLLLLLLYLPARRCLLPGQQLPTQVPSH
jgi:hypothetical protein